MSVCQRDSRCGWVPAAGEPKTQLQDRTEAFTVYADIVCLETGIVGSQFSGFCVFSAIRWIAQLRGAKREEMAKRKGRSDKDSRRNAARLAAVSTGRPVRRGDPDALSESTALSVITSRALPDLRDGLKPVQRRNSYAMWHDLHVTADSRHIKCAAVVGEVMKTYHPHGDQSILTICAVRMAPAVQRQGDADRRLRQFRLDRRRPACRLSLHRMPVDADRTDAFGRVRGTDGELPAQLCLDGRRTDRVAWRNTPTCW